MRLWGALLLALLAQAVAGDESCMGRCENGFDSQRACQCDSMCKYYKSCCSDFEATCGMMTRGDTFVFAEDDDDLLEGTTPSPGRSAHSQSFTAISRQLEPTQQPMSDFDHGPRQHQETPLQMTKPPRLTDTILQKIPIMRKTPISQTVPPTQKLQELPNTTKPPQNGTAAEATTAPTTAATTEAPDPDAVVCSGRPFDAFMQLKNGSIYAFRGDYFFELDQKSVLPGYPKLIKDVWGISGPIDAAFTRVNCQGKSYIFKGNKYWRFDDGVLDDDYPRDISVGFDKIPDHVDAAFALPAPGHNGKEKVYFFKGDQYYTYEFLHQPSHEECITMSETSPSMLFRRYTEVYYNNYERFLSELFSDLPQHHDKHHFIERDWKGLRSPVDAVLTGRMYVPPLRPARRDQQWGRQQGQQWNQQYGQQYGQPVQHFQQNGQQFQQFQRGGQLVQQFQQNGQQFQQFQRDGQLVQQFQQGGQPVQQFQQGGQQWVRRRQSRSPFWQSMAEQGMNMGQAFAERGMEMGMRLAERRMEMEERLGRDWDRRWDQDWDQDRRRDGYRQNNRGNYDSRSHGWYWGSVQRQLPIQTVYFFRGDKYYRVDLRTKRVDPAMPPYPRSIAQYWLGCSDTPGAEK